MRKFADDTKVGAVVDTQAKCEHLQKQIDALTRWADIWQMSLNADKCVVCILATKICNTNTRLMALQ